MHKSRLAGFIIDCKDADLARAAEFWGAALGLGVSGGDEPSYVRLDGRQHELTIEVQRVSHESRVHLDVESDDIEAEVARLEQLGAKRVANVKSWVVLEAPTGQRFCVVRAKEPLEGKPGTRTHR
ncbi:MAG TPA: VOC family protein [Myxococcota bacterium]|nr:VOC family protein [Myxococcota bacterium]